MPYTPSFLKEMKSSLTQELDMIEQDLSGVSTPDRHDHVAGANVPTFTHSEEMGDEQTAMADDFAEHAVNVDVTFTLEQQEEKVRAALQAIEDGTYGVCTGCGDDIDEERLRANPSSDLCMACVA